jgi:hypothetical protein
MIRMVLTVAILAATTLATAAQPTPQPKVGPCPSGYTESGGYCAPMRQNAPIAVPKTGQCPSGFIQSGAYYLEQPRR